MANYKAVANGNWSNLAIWQDNSSGSFVASTVLPRAADDVYSNSYQVTIDQNITVASIRNNSTTGIANGSYSGFYITTSKTLTFTGLGVYKIAPNFGGWWMSLIYITGSNLTLNIIGNITNDTTGNSGALNMSGSNVTVNITGNIITGPYQSDQSVVSVGANCTVNHTGNVYGATTSNASLNGRAIVISNNGVYNLTGSAIAMAGTEVITSLPYGSTNAQCNIIGSTISAGQIVVYGTVLKMAGIIYNFNDFSVAPYMIKTFDGQQLEWRSRTTTNVLNPLYTAGVSIGFPATNNVRTGITYGPTNNLTGTCAVPPAAAVSIGVPVDNTVGTGYLNATDIWNVPLASITTPNSIGERLKDASTVQTTGAQLAAFLP